MCIRDSPTVIAPLLPETPEEQRLFDVAKKRRAAKEVTRSEADAS